MVKEIKPRMWDDLNGLPEVFDNQFLISDFCTAIEKSETKSNSTIDSIKIAILRAYEKEESESKFVVNFTDEIKQAMVNGEVRLDTGKNGDIYAQLRCSNGRLGAKLSIKEELQNEGVSAEDLKLAMQMDAIKEQLDIIVEGMKAIENKVTEVIQGQHNDRIGLLYSGFSLYVESKVISDEALRKLLVSQALKSVSDANYQVIQEIRTAMEYLVTEQYRANKKAMLAMIAEKLNVIKQGYVLVFRASFFKAIVYQENSEFTAMTMALDEYSRFIEKLIIPYAKYLHELDKESRFFNDSVWGKMAYSLQGCNEMKQKLISDEGVYLRLGGHIDVER